ncbi:hypothetical protein [Xylella fastidiosa]|uniref:hypothetical protein n=1 Tax=Xylella fastidiosa TaxID=2371 RepID=UPI00111FD406|nr:hypothetical protein [Xylella fastidiosa]TNW23329.1 hypothetical protein EIP73_11070 [Xylella fastidiosa subsp. pauca]TNW23345.1 hypothetical protein EIP73_11155 [Xylella fastidiosa subsp. pauca]TNW25380.1 hypothetical protein EIP74_02485 [Xylella fastidiosa subsp. pauca]
MNDKYGKVRELESWDEVISRFDRIQAQALALSENAHIVMENMTGIIFSLGILRSRLLAFSASSSDFEQQV